MSLKTRLVASRLRTLPHQNARDLSEPPNGTTSGCPPPPHQHNYRTFLHTQQMNRLETCESDRFWMGVAQITRKRDRYFHASNCFIIRFPISSICPSDRCVRPLHPVFPHQRACSRRIACTTRLFFRRSCVERSTVKDGHFNDRKRRAR